LEEKVEMRFRLEQKRRKQGDPEFPAQRPVSVE
jgi:hypothetical protein